MPHLQYSVLEEGVKNEATAHYQGHLIRVITGYNIIADDWPFHVYVKDAAGVETKLEIKPMPSAPTILGAWDAAFALARQQIDAAA
jgi:hypothetical protein